MNSIPILVFNYLLQNKIQSYYTIRNTHYKLLMSCELTYTNIKLGKLGPFKKYNIIEKKKFGF